MKLLSDNLDLLKATLSQFTAEDVLFSRHLPVLKKQYNALYNLSNDEELREHFCSAFFKIEILNWLKTKIEIDETLSPIDLLIQKEREFKDYLVSIHNYIEESNVKLLDKNYYNPDYIKRSIHSNVDSSKKITSFISRMEKFKSEFLTFFEVSSAQSNKDFLRELDFQKEKQSLQLLSVLLLNVEIDNFSYSFSNGEDVIETDFLQESFPKLRSVKNNDAIASYIELLKPNTNILPADWKKELYKQVNFLLPNPKGFYNERYFELQNFSEEEKLNTTEISYLIALKNNINNDFVVNEDHEIFLPLSGGIMCVISIKEFLSENVSKDEIYLFLDNDAQNKRITNSQLYSIQGYSGGSISIEVPRGFLMRNGKYLYTIQFKAAPVLFENNVIQRVANSLLNDSAMSDDDDYNDNYNYNRR